MTHEVLSGQQAAMAQVAGRTAPLEGALHELRRELDRVADEAATTNQAVRAEVADHVAILDQRLQGVETLQRELDGVYRELDRLAGNLSGGDGLITEMAERLLPLEDVVVATRRELHEAREDHVAAAGRVEEVIARVTEMSDEMTRRVEEVEGNVAVRVTEVSGELTRRVEAMEGDVAARVTEVSDDLTRRVLDVENGVAARLAEVADVVTLRVLEVADDVARRVDEIEGRATQQVEAVAGEVEGVGRRIDVVGERIDMVEERVDMVGERVNTVDERLATLGVLTSDVEGMYRELDRVAELTLSRDGALAQIADRTTPLEISVAGLRQELERLAGEVVVAQQAKLGQVGRPARRRRRPDGLARAAGRPGRRAGPRAAPGLGGGGQRPAGRPRRHHRAAGAGRAPAHAGGAAGRHRGHVPRLRAGGRGRRQPAKAARATPSSARPRSTPPSRACGPSSSGSRPRARAPSSTCAAGWPAWSRSPATSTPSTGSWAGSPPWPPTTRTARPRFEVTVAGVRDSLAELRERIEDERIYTTEQVTGLWARMRAVEGVPADIERVTTEAETLAEAVKRAFGDSNETIEAVTRRVQALEDLPADLEVVRREIDGLAEAARLREEQVAGLRDQLEPLGTALADVRDQIDGVRTALSSVDEAPARLSEFDNRLAKLEALPRDRRRNPPPAHRHRRGGHRQPPGIPGQRQPPAAGVQRAAPDAGGAARRHGGPLRRPLPGGGVGQDPPGGRRDLVAGGAGAVRRRGTSNRGDGYPSLVTSRASPSRR